MNYVILYKLDLLFDASMVKNMIHKKLLLLIPVCFFLSSCLAMFGGEYSKNQHFNGSKYAMSGAANADPNNTGYYYFNVKNRTQTLDVNKRNLVKLNIHPNEFESYFLTLQDGYPNTAIKRVGCSLQTKHLQDFNYYTCKHSNTGFTTIYVFTTYDNYGYIKAFTNHTADNLPSQTEQEIASALHNFYYAKW